MRSLLVWVLSATLLLVAVGLPAAIACTGDSEGLELIDGELPGGG